MGMTPTFTCVVPPPEEAESPAPDDEDPHPAAAAVGLTLGLAALALAAWSAAQADDRDQLSIGVQPDGRILVPTNQILKPAGKQVTFPGRPVDLALSAVGGEWLNRPAVMKAWQRYLSGEGDSSFYVWQWINLGLMCDQPSWAAAQPAAAPFGDAL